VDVGAWLPPSIPVHYRIQSIVLMVLTQNYLALSITYLIIASQIFALGKHMGSAARI